MKEKYDEQERLKAAINNIVSENLYLYILEIDYENKEIAVEFSSNESRTI